jgi:hypothetical protein
LLNSLRAFLLRIIKAAASSGTAPQYVKDLSSPATDARLLPPGSPLHIVTRLTPSFHLSSSHPRVRLFSSPAKVEHKVRSPDPTLQIFCEKFFREFSTHSGRKLFKDLRRYASPDLGP